MRVDTLRGAQCMAAANRPNITNARAHHSQSFQASGSPEGRRGRGPPLTRPRPVVTSNHPSTRRRRNPPLQLVLLRGSSVTDAKLPRRRAGGRPRAIASRDRSLRTWSSEFWSEKAPQTVGFSLQNSRRRPPGYRQNGASVIASSSSTPAWSASLYCHTTLRPAHEGKTAGNAPFP